MGIMGRRMVPPLGEDQAEPDKGVKDTKSQGVRRRAWGMGRRDWEMGRRTRSRNDSKTQGRKGKG